MYTQDGRLFLKSCRLRDGTGGVDVDVVSKAVPALYGCCSAEELEEHLRTQSLSSAKVRFNVRGVLREENGTTRRYVLQVEPTPLDAVVSTSAMRLSLGLSTVTGDVVLPAPVCRVGEAPLVGMAVQKDGGQLIGAFRLLPLVRGTMDAVCDPIDDSIPMAQQTFSKSHLKACSAF